jgi:hypothetical protein
VKKREFEESDLIMMFDIRYHRKANKKLLPKWFGPFVIRKEFADTGFMSLKMLMAHHIQITLVMTS